MRISDWSSDVCSSDLGIAAVKDVGIFGEKAENQPRHEMVHVRAALGDPPIGIVFQQLDIELVEAARGANVERTFAHLLDGADPGKWQEETEMIRELGEGAGDGFAACQILRLERLAVRRPAALGLGPRGGGGV